MLSVVCDKNKTIIVPSTYIFNEYISFLRQPLKQIKWWCIFKKGKPNTYIQRKSGFRHGQPQADARRYVFLSLRKGEGLDKAKIKKYFFFQVNVHKDSKARSAEKSSLESLPNQQEHRCPWSPSVISVPKCQPLGWLVGSYFFYFLH